MASSQNRQQKQRSWVSVLLGGVMLGLVLTGLMSFALPYSPTLSGIHTWFGIAFLLAIAFHLRNNLRVLLGYLRARLARRQMATLGASVFVVIVGVALSFPPFSSVLDFGYKLRKTQAVEEGSYQTLYTRIGKQGMPIQVALRAGEHYQSPPQPLFFGLSYRSTPQLVLWLEDMEGNYLQTLYVTKKIAGSEFRLADLGNTELQRRPEALPYWAHKRGVVEDDGLVVPQHNTADLDGVTGATPQGHYDVASVVTEAPKRFRLLLEVNRSYDFNEYYHKERFPDDPVYSGSGSSGQPSLVYEAVIEPSANRSSHVLKPIGHGHYSGKDGNLYTDMTGITTAFGLLEMAVATVGAHKGATL